MELYTRKRNPAQVQSRARAYLQQKRNPAPTELQIVSCPQKKKKIARAKKLPSPRETVVRARKGRIRFSPSAIAPPAPAARKSAIPQSRNCATRKTEERKKTEEKIYRLRGRIFIVGLFGSGVASSVSSSSKSGINDFSRFSGAADFSAGCSASTRMARLPLL